MKRTSYKIVEPMNLDDWTVEGGKLLSVGKNKDGEIILIVERSHPFDIDIETIKIETVA